MCGNDCGLHIKKNIISIFFCMFIGNLDSSQISSRNLEKKIKAQKLKRLILELACDCMCEYNSACNCVWAWQTVKHINWKWSNLTSSLGPFKVKLQESLQIGVIPNNVKE